MERPKEVNQALMMMKALLGTFSPQTFWRGEVTRPIETYIKDLENELNRRGIQASLTLAKRIEEENKKADTDEDDKDISQDCKGVFD